MVLPNFKENLEKYAKLLVANGINVQPGHTLALSIDVEQRELAHLIVKEAYALGAHEVIVQWTDDVINREKFLHAHPRHKLLSRSNAPTRVAQHR